MTSGDLAKAKQDMRKAALAARKHVPDRAARSLAAARHLENWLRQRRSGALIGLYWPIRDEADALGLMDLYAATYALPVVTGRSQPLVFRQWARGDALVGGDYNIPRPADSALLVQPDILIVPLAAFDATGRRMGYGGGFYDRTIAGLRNLKSVTTIGFAFAAQEVAQVPIDEFDQRLDAVVTEKALNFFGAKPALN